ncbi:MAG: Hpt domain-containing protein [Bacteroidetes bacterium]|nr:Hpt domain-containing protein [Bacteroidota bacterium]
MSNYANDKPFIFNGEINVQSINELYGDDYAYIEEVFDTVLKEYELLTNNIIAAYDSKNTPVLKAAVHKIKPIFGFVGLLKVQQQCQQFENTCHSATAFESVVDEFGSLKNSLIKSKSLIEEEKKKLELFNNQRA